MSIILKNFTLLYVEDDKDTVNSIEELLKDKVKELYVAYDGKEGLDVYKEVKPDIVLTDISMPKMSGIEMSMKIKELNSNQSIIILTAFNENSLLHESVDIGVDGYITKPILDIDKMLEPIIKTAQRLQSTIDQKRVEHLLEVQGKTAAVGEMIGNIAHQWRQPLNLISILASKISFSVELGDKIEDKELNEISNNIVNQTKYLSKTIDDFRDFLKADTSNKKNINIKNIVIKVEELIKASMDDNDIKCILNLQDCSLKINENQLIQALLNICNNSKDALIEMNKDRRYFFVNLTKKQNCVTISLRDSAGGIDEKIMDRVFEPYFTTKESLNGTGIGLYMTFQIIVSHFKGTIEAKNINYKYNNKKLKGAQFIIKLPV